MATLLRLIQSLAPPATAQSVWRPTADVYQCRDGWLVKFDLAGVCPDDIEVSVAGPCLSVRGTRRDSCIRDGHRAYSLEIAYSQFERVIELPCDIQAARISTEYRDGMLLVRLVTQAGGG